MAKVKPFRAIRPTRDKSALVSMWSYPTYSKDMIEARIKTNPFSFLHIMDPGFRYGLEEGGLFRFKMVKKIFENFRERGVFLQDSKPCFYVYSQDTKDHTFIGIVAASSVKDYYDNVIKTHEQTLTKREELFKDYIKISGFNAEPVLITYPNNDSIDSMINKYIVQRPEYEFCTTNEFIHKLWVIDNDDDIKFIERNFEDVGDIYIADGHHRSSSSALLSRELSKKSESKEAPYNYFLSLFVSEKNLKIYSFNRLVRDLKGMTEGEFLSKLEKSFSIEKIDYYKKPIDNNSFLMYMDSDFYYLKLKNYDIEEGNPLDILPPYILSKTILDPILDIKDLKIDKRIDFQSEKVGIENMKKKVDSGEFKVAFISYPVNFSQIKEISDNQLIMPPKSTYIEPKLRAGLLIYDIYN